jgi:hypothetical protein
MAFAFVFPGQGSQSVGMMAAYGDSPVLRATFDEASAALGQDLWQLLADGPAEALAQTVNTQPVMLTAGVAVYRLWLDRGGKVPASSPGTALASTRRWLLPASSPSRTRCRWFGCVLRRCRKRCRRARGRWRPFSVSMTRRLPRPVSKQPLRQDWRGR